MRLGRIGLPSHSIFNIRGIMFTDYYKHFVDWMTESRMYYTTLQQLYSLSDKELHDLNLSRDTLIHEVNKTYMAKFANK
jgi:uncharacterized protein YjiS (DUF1127 family)